MEGLSRQDADAVALFQGGSFDLIRPSDATGLPGGPKAFLSFCRFGAGVDLTVRQWEWLLKEGYVQLADLAPIAKEFLSRASFKAVKTQQDIFRRGPSELSIYDEWDRKCASAARAAKEGK